MSRRKPHRLVFVAVSCPTSPLAHAFLLVWTAKPPTNYSLGVTPSETRGQSLLRQRTEAGAPRKVGLCLGIIHVAEKASQLALTNTSWKVYGAQQSLLQNQPLSPSQVKPQFHYSNILHSPSASLQPLSQRSYPPASVGPPALNQTLLGTAHPAMVSPLGLLPPPTSPVTLHRDTVSLSGGY